MVCVDPQYDLPRGSGASGAIKPRSESACQNACGTARVASARFWSNSATVRAPGIMLPTAGCASGNCSAAARSGTSYSAQTRSIASTRATRPAGAAASVNYGALPSAGCAPVARMPELYGPPMTTATPRRWQSGKSSGRALWSSSV